MTVSTKTGKILTVLISLFFLYLVIRGFFGSFWVDLYVFHEWLVNYSFGFIRRGLPGTFLLYLNETYSLDPYLVVRVISYLTLFSFIAVYLLKVIKNFKSLPVCDLLVLLFLSSLIVFSVINRQIPGRKEFLFFLFTAAHLFLVKINFQKYVLPPEDMDGLDAKKLESATKSYVLQSVIVLNCLAIPILLSHEAFLVFTLPLNMMVFFRCLQLTKTTRKSVVLSLAAFLPSLIAALAVFYQDNNAFKVNNLYLQWQNILHDKYELSLGMPYPFITMLWTPQDVFKIYAQDLNSLKIFYWVLICLIFFAVLLIHSQSLVRRFSSKRGRDDQPPQEKGRSADNRLVGSFFLRYLVVPFLISLPIYIIAVDWGRWIFVVCITYALCLLTPSLIAIESVLGLKKEGPVKNKTTGSPNGNRASDFVGPILCFPQRHPKIYSVFLGYVILFVHLPYSIGIGEEDFFKGLLFKIIQWMEYDIHLLISKF